MDKTDKKQRIIKLDFQYPDSNKRCRLYYVKAMVTGTERDKLIHLHKASHPEFPNDSTANQFLTKEQGKAYERLGRESALDLLQVVTKAPCFR